MLKMAFVEKTGIEIFEPESLSGHFLPLYIFGHTTHFVTFATHLMNLGLVREVTAVSRSVDGDLATRVTRIRCFQVRKRIRVDVPNKSALLWMSCLSQFV